MKYLFILFVLFNISLISAEIGYELSWDEDEIINGNEFEINVNLDGGDELYDGKLWIEYNEKIITDRLDDKKNEWKSSYYYINEYFQEGINVVKLVIDQEFRDFEGRTFIHFRIRGGDEIKETIEILSKKSDDDKETIEQEEPRVEILEEKYIDTKAEVQIQEPISLGKKVSKANQGIIEKDINSEIIVYESKGTKIISSSVYGFAILCVLLCVLVIWRKLD